MKKADEALLESRISTINVALIQLKKDVEDECLPCLEHHQKVITDTLYEISFDLEEKLEQQ